MKNTAKVWEEIVEEAGIVSVEMAQLTCGMISRGDGGFKYMSPEDREAAIAAIMLRATGGKLLVMPLRAS
jgi:hypothetical protein